MAAQESPSDVEQVVADAAARLYAAVPGEFMAERRHLVAQAKGRDDIEAADRKAAATAIGALRKPTSSAWLINRLTRVDADLLARLVEVSSRLRRAQSRLDASALRDLRGDRDAVIEAVIDALPAAVEGLDGAPARSEATLGEVRATVVAAMADEAALDAVRSGALTRALSYSGFGEVDLSDAVALTPTGVRLQVLPDDGDGGDERDEDEATGTDAADDDTDTGTDALEQALEDAEEAVQRAGERVRAARAAAKESRTAVDRLRAELRTAIDTDEQAMAEVTDAVRARKEAERARQRAEDALDS